MAQVCRLVSQASHAVKYAHLVKFNDEKLAMIVGGYATDSDVVPQGKPQTQEYDIIHSHILTANVFFICLDLLKNAH